MSVTICILQRILKTIHFSQGANWGITENMNDLSRGAKWGITEFVNDFSMEAKWGITENMIDGRRDGFCQILSVPSKFEADLKASSSGRIFVVCLVMVID